MSKLPVYLRETFAIIPEAEAGFATTLSVKDRRRLHKILRKVHLKFFPAHLITDYECDKLLNAFGPAVQQTLLKAAVDRGLV
jgi:hypothetical protein